MFIGVIKRWCIFILIFHLFCINPAFSENANKIAKNTFPSVVILIMEDESGEPISFGSGFFIKNGIIVTNFHVIKGANSGCLKLINSEKKDYILGVTAIDEENDLVLLRTDNLDAPILTIGDSNNVAIGDDVYVVGNPQGLEGTFSKGIISSIRKKDNDSILQITAPISPGSSGGPVLNDTGQVIGVAVASFVEGQNLNFAIPSNYIKKLLESAQKVIPLNVLLSEIKNKSNATAKEEDIGVIFAIDEDIIVNIAGTGATRFLRVGIAFEIENNKVKSEIQNRIKEIRDLITLIIGSKKMEQIDNINDRDKLKREIQERINEKLESGNIWNVFFTDFIIQ